VQLEGVVKTAVAGINYFGGAFFAETYIGGNFCVCVFRGVAVEYGEVFRREGRLFFKGKGVDTGERRDIASQTAEKFRQIFSTPFNYYSGAVVAHRT